MAELCPGASSTYNANSTTYLYDTGSNVLQMTDALNHTTSPTYSNDNKLTDTNALGKTSTYTNDQFGNRLTETDRVLHLRRQRQPADQHGSRRARHHLHL